MVRKPLISRRRVLALVGSSGVAIPVTSIWAHLVHAQGLAHTTTASVPPASCIATTQQTEGPFFVDDQLNRSDIRVDPVDGSLKEGVPLRLFLRVSSIGAICAPLAGAQVDIWHCDATGRYSNGSASGLAASDKKFLRGYQLTNANGDVQFTTIYPGGYRGRAVHIHFKVRTPTRAGFSQELTSQFYFDDALTDRVHMYKPYAIASQYRLRNENDGIFRHGGAQLILALKEQGDGYAGHFDIGLLVASNASSK